MLDGLVRVFPFISREHPLSRDLAQLVQICTSIHSGHPEKYEEVTKLIDDLDPNILLSEEALERVKLDEAWIPLAL